MAGACSVNNPSSLLTEFVRTHERASCLEIETRMSSEVKSILPLANRLIRLIEESRCVIGEEPAVEFGLELVGLQCVVRKRYWSKGLIAWRNRTDCGARRADSTRAIPNQIFRWRKNGER
jgi:hypothetical protein